MRVVVIGGGVIGTAAARELAMAGATVTLLERGAAPEGASWVAAGMLSPLAEAAGPDPFLDLLRAGRDLYPAFARALAAETGIDVRYRGEGTLLVAVRSEDEAEVEERFRWQSLAGLEVERVSARELLSEEPLLSPAVRGGLRFPGDHQVDNRLLLTALQKAAGRAGVTVRRGVEAVRLLREGERAAGVEAADGERIEGEWVVVAGGAGAGLLRELPRSLPVRPVHGQIVALRTGAPALRHVVDSPRAYLVPRIDGELLVGATVEEIGFRRGATVEGVRGLLAGAIELCPALSAAAIVELRAGHRPGTPDGWPVLGADPALHGLVYAAGHYRNGILLAPITARMVAALVTGHEPPFDPSPFSITRFPPAEQHAGAPSA